MTQNLASYNAVGGFAPYAPLILLIAGICIVLYLISKFLEKEE